MPAAPEGQPASGGMFRRWFSRRVVVADESMAPTLRPGDRLLVDRRAYRRRLPVVGQVVVLDDPERPGRWLVKRVSAVDGSAGVVEVRGDALDRARDSRRFGPVPLGSVVGLVYRLYHPPSRRRNL